MYFITINTYSMCGRNCTAENYSSEPTKNNTPRDCDDKKKLNNNNIMNDYMYTLQEKKNYIIALYYCRLTHVLSTGFVPRFGLQTGINSKYAEISFTIELLSMTN